MKNLGDLDRAVAQAHRRDGGDETEVREGLIRAARELLVRQCLYRYESQQGNHYRIIEGSVDYFESLFGAFGYELRIRPDNGYAMLVPMRSIMAGRRGSISKDETLMLFTLRLIWEEGMRDYSMLDTGQIEVTLDDLDDRFRIPANREVIAQGRLKEILKDLQSRGLVKVGAYDPEEDSTALLIYPTIREVVTPELARMIAAFAEGSEEEARNLRKQGDDVIEWVELARSLDEPAADPTATGDCANRIAAPDPRGEDADV